MRQLIAGLGPPLGQGLFARPGLREIDLVELVEQRHLCLGDGPGVTGGNVRFGLRLGDRALGLRGQKLTVALPLLVPRYHGVAHHRGSPAQIFPLGMTRSLAMLARARLHVGFLLRRRGPALTMGG